MVKQTYTKGYTIDRPKAEFDQNRPKFLTQKNFKDISKTDIDRTDKKKSRKKSQDSRKILR